MADMQVWLGWLQMSSSLLMNITSHPSQSPIQSAGSPS
jgi:hypothetical protein